MKSLSTCCDSTQNLLHLLGHLGEEGSVKGSLQFVTHTSYLQVSQNLLPTCFCSLGRVLRASALSMKCLWISVKSHLSRCVMSFLSSAVISCSKTSNTRSVLSYRHLPTAQGVHAHVGATAQDHSDIPQTRDRLHSAKSAEAIALDPQPPTTNVPGGVQWSPGNKPCDLSRKQLSPGLMEKHECVTR